MWRLISSFCEAEDPQNSEVAEDLAQNRLHRILDWLPSALPSPATPFTTGFEQDAFHLRVEGIELGERLPTVASPCFILLLLLSCTALKSNLLPVGAVNVSMASRMTVRASSTIATRGIAPYSLRDRQLVTTRSLQLVRIG